MPYQAILLEREGPLAIVTLNRPEKRNAIDRTMFDEVEAAFGELAADEGCRVVILTGAGGAFSSGADLASGAEDVASRTAPGFHERMREVGRMIEAVASFPKPVIAAVSGVAAGGGCNLALVCDIVLASEDARFAELFVRRGLTVDMGGIWALPRRVGLHRAKELAFTGDFVDAKEAADMGLVNRVVPAAALLDEAKDLARRIAANAPVAIRLAKEGLNRSSTMTLAEALEYESQAQAICFASEDVQEGVAAFFQKREPEFRGR